MLGSGINFDSYYSDWRNEGPDIRELSMRTPRARKEHRCVLCRDPILPGQRYTRCNYDCYDGYLVGLYSRNGFREVARMPWDGQYADPRWDEQRWGTPDVVHMKLETE